MQLLSKIIFRFENTHLDKDHKCEICEKTFRNPSDLSSNHILTTHDCRKNEKCNICVQLLLHKIRLEEAHQFSS